MLQPGIYKATVFNHGIGETQAGEPQAVVQFSVEGAGQVTWYGSFKEKAREITIKALLTCGLQGNDPTGALEVGKEVSITVDHDEDTEGKTRARVKWVNPLGGGYKKMDPALAKAKLSSLEGAVMAARQKLGGSDEIPF